MISIIIMTMMMMIIIILEHVLNYCYELLSESSYVNCLLYFGKQATYF